jgi:Galactose oxidase, central domain
VRGWKYRAALGCALVAIVFAATHGIRAELPQAVGTWASLGATPESRIGAAAVVLPDGRTIITGGSVAGAATDSVVAFNPADGTFVSIGHLLVARAGHTATLLDDGHVLIAGGTSGDLISADLELFDPASGLSTLGGSMSQARTGHSAAKLLNGMVLIAGGSGVDGVLQNAEIYDPATATTSPTVLPMLSPRTGASATTLIDGRVLIAGGSSNGTTDLASAEIFNPWSQIFEAATTTLSVARRGHAAVLLPQNNSVLIAGGTSNGVSVTTTDLFVPAEFPDPYSYGMGAFAPTGSLNSARAGAIASPHIEGYAVAIGGGAPDAEVYRFPTIKTDKDDYAPGTKAIITGSGWQADTDVTLVFQEDPAVHDDYILHVTADGNGNIDWREWAPEEHDLNVRFYLMAKQTTPEGERRAQMTFTDAQPMKVTVTPTSVSVLAGAPAAFTVNVQVGGNSTNCTMTLSASALPTGASASFTNSPITTNADYQSNLTITTTNTGPIANRTPSGSFSFTVTANRVAGCQGSGGETSTPSNTLVVLDVTNPTTASVSVPANGSSFTAATVPGIFSGNAADNTNGVGLDANTTTLTLQRPDGMYWTGSTWVVAVTPLSTTHPATTSDTTATWTRSTGMPVWASQPFGTYTVRASAIDKSGNSFSGVPISFTLQSPGPTTLAFTNSPFSGAVNSCLGPFVVQSQNSSNVATNVTSNTTVDLSTNQSGAFYSDAACTSAIANRTISNGTNNTGNFYYKPTAFGTGTHTLTAADHAAVLTSATQPQTIGKATPVISFGAAPTPTFGGSNFTVSATTTNTDSSALTYSVVSGPCALVSGATFSSSGAGTCVVQASGAATANFIAASNTQSVTIGKATPTVTIAFSPNSVSFDANPHAAIATVTGVNSALLTGSDGTTTITYLKSGNPSGTPTNAGSYTASASFISSNANYNNASSTMDATLTISRATPTATLTVTNSPQNYDNSAKSATVGVTSSVPGTVVNVVTGAATTQTNAGTYAVTADFVPDDTTNYNSLLGLSAGNFVINKALTTTTVSCGAGPFTYNGAAQTPCSATATGAGGLNDTLTVSYADNINAGTAHASASYAATVNYEASSDDETFVIAKAATTTTVSCGAGPFTYNGAAQTPCSANVTGAGGLNQVLTVSYTDNINAGTAHAGASYVESANYLGSSDSEDFTIAKAATTTTVSCGAGPFTYNGAAQTPCSATATGAGGLNDTLTVSYTDNTNAGTAHADASYAESTNYLGSSDSKTFDIAKAATTTTMTCGAGPFTYNGSPQTPCSANVTGAGGLNQMVTVTYTDNIDAGTAHANASFAGDGNHTGSNDSKTFTIDKATSTATVTCPASVTYNGGAQTPCSAAAAGAGGLNQALTVNYANNTNAGTASASASFTGDTNHTGSNDSKNFTIDKAPSTTTVACPASVTYNGSAQTPCSAAATGTSGLNQPLTVNYANNTDAGIATAGANYAGDSNHNPSSDSKNFTIDKANSITAVTCPASVAYTGSAVTPCSAKTTGAGGLNHALAVTYANNINPGPAASASAAYAGDANHNGSNDSKNFAIGYADCSAAYGPGNVILPPINNDGSSVFNKKGSTIPVKFRVCDAAGRPISVAAAVFAGTGGTLTMKSAVRGTVDAANESLTADIPDVAFRWDGTSQWIFNMATSNLIAGNTYVFSINLASGGTIQFQIGVK